VEICKFCLCLSWSLGDSHQRLNKATSLAYLVPTEAKRIQKLLKVFLQEWWPSATMKVIFVVLERRLIWPIEDKVGVEEHLGDCCKLRENGWHFFRFSCTGDVP